MADDKTNGKKKRRLSQIVGAEVAINAEQTKTLSEIHLRSGGKEKETAKPELFSGLSKTYTPKGTEGEDAIEFPPQHVPVRAVAADLITEAFEVWQRGLNITATKDYGNMAAKADVKVNGTMVLGGVPVHFLLFLEKKILNDFRTLIAKMPVLDPSFEWEEVDGAAGTYKTEPVTKLKTRKAQRAVVKYPHQFSDDGKTAIPAQTEIITEDIVQGHYDEVRLSGAMTRDRKQEILRRINELLVAVKEAREEANSIRVDDVDVGRKLAEFVLGI